VLLHKGGVGITPTSITPPEKSTYKNGKVSMGFFEKDRAIHNTSVASDSQLKALLLKEGAKVWVSAILVEGDGVIFRLNTGKDQRRPLLRQSGLSVPKWRNAPSRRRPQDHRRSGHTNKSR
jgi:hypothetical protein